MLSLAVLAAVAIHVALRTGRRFAVAAVVAAFALLLVEHAVSIPTTYSLKPQPWAVWLRHQPFGSVANYPMPTDKRAALVLLAQSYYDQTYDHQPQFMLFGSGYGDTREDAIRILARYVTDPLTPGILKAEQVKYVLLHDDVYRAQGETPPPIPAGMHLVARLPDHVRALELDADVQPADLSSVLQQNAASIALVEGLPVPTATPKDVTPIPGGFAVDPSGELDLSWKDTAALAYVQFLVHAHADGGARTLQLTDGAGNVVAAASVGTGDTQLTLGPVPVSGLSARFGVRSAPAGRIAVTALQVQPVANVTKTIRAIH
jgi:hypothetical protein